MCDDSLNCDCFTREILRGPQFVKYFGAVLQALRELGDSGRPKEIYPLVARICSVSESELSQTNQNGGSKFENQVAWARFYLVKAGYIDSSKRGVWSLTETGRNGDLDQETSLKIFKQVQDEISKERAGTETEIEGSSNEASDPLTNSEAPDERQFFNEDQARRQIAEHLTSMSPEGFERYCAYLLRVFGLQNVKVTGQVGDQGIDGEGDLMINRFVRSKVMFQCKRYVGSVGPKEIRDFRGAILGRAERGVFLTTGVFTSNAKVEAVRENTVPIELIDLDELVELAIEESVGVDEVRALKVNDGFFEKYQQNPDQEL